MLCYCVLTHSLLTHVMRRYGFVNHSSWTTAAGGDNPAGSTSFQPPEQSFTALTELGKEKGHGEAWVPHVVLHLPASEVECAVEDEEEQEGEQGEMQGHTQQQREQQQHLLLSHAGMVRTLVHELGHVLHLILSSRWGRGREGKGGKEGLGAGVIRGGWPSWPSGTSQRDRSTPVDLCLLLVVYPYTCTAFQRHTRPCTFRCLPTFTPRMLLAAGPHAVRRPPPWLAIPGSQRLPPEHTCLLAMAPSPGSPPEACACHSSTDLLELPSHLLERWAADPHTLAQVARHALRWGSGPPLPS